jgi:hypothetical protein
MIQGMEQDTSVNTELIVVEKYKGEERITKGKKCQNQECF